ncbi:MAG: hypothetical protein KUF72_09075 [Candidatus Thiodiazotropha sp. (ex Ctena orbiculata)]|nr:hypothetical protein [Candidatus Thiodiazotropha taylori]
MNTTALIDPTPPNEDMESVEAIFKSIEKSFGLLPDGLVLYGISPPLLKSFVDSFSYLANHDQLSQQLLGLIRYLNSNSVECPYCIDFNAGFLVGLGTTPEQLQATLEEIGNAPLNENEKALLSFTMKSLNEPENITREDLQTVRDCGFTDRNIFDAVVAAANNRAFTTVLKTFDVIQQGASFPKYQTDAA